MRRNRGLLIGIIVTIIILVIVLVGVILYTFVFNKDKNKDINNNNIANIEPDQPNQPEPPVEEEPDLKVGEYIDYTPDTASNYVLTGTNSGVVNNVAEGIAQEELNWRILNINDDGTIDIISEDPITTEVYFGGALGYNNGVYLLNDICEKLYSNKRLGAKARSINLEDIEDKMSRTALSNRDSYGHDEVHYGEVKTYMGQNAFVPEIYTKKSGDADQESKAYYSNATTSTFIPQNDVGVKQTFYEVKDLTEASFEEEITYELLFETSTTYWLATRCTDCGAEYAIFGLRSIGKSSITGAAICASNSKSASNKNFVRPIVTLGEDVKISVEGGTKSNPRTITKRDTTSSGDEISKIDENEDWVYNAEYSNEELEGKSYKSTVTGTTYSLKDINLPYINIDSPDAEEANEEINKIFEAAAKIFKEELEGEQASYITTDYEIYVDDEILSILVSTEMGGEEETKDVYYTYNFNINDGTKLSYDEIYSLAGISDDEIEEKVENSITEDFGRRYKGLAEGYEDDFDKYNEASIKNYKDSVENKTIKAFIDKNEKLNIVVDLAIPTGSKKYQAIVTVK